MAAQGWPAGNSRKVQARLRPSEQPGSDVDFPPIANGLDYLLSVITLLADDEERVSARDLKYAVLHLQAAAEVLLKYRLQQEHWTLVFADPGKARKEELADGSLASCTPAQTVDRLQRIVGLPIGDKDSAALMKLAKTRNALQHYGLTDRSRAVEARTAEVLDFLVRFLDEQLLPALTDEDQQRTTQDMQTIRDGLSRIQGFVTRRLQRLRAYLEPRRNRTMACPHCDQWTLVVTDDTDDASGCCFCTSRFDTVDYVLWASIPAFRGCPGCKNRTLVCHALTAAAPEVPVDLCFSCGKTFPPLRRCLWCKGFLSQHHSEDICFRCLMHG